MGKVVKLEDVIISEKDGEHTLKEGAMEYVEIKGGWSREIKVNDKVYWSIEDYPLLSITENGYKCPSDGRFRPDLKALISNDEETSQNEKEKLEVLQRADRKLRASFASNTK